MLSINGGRTHNASYNKAAIAIAVAFLDTGLQEWP